ncbi:hypothetical protein ACG93R_22130 [Acinetobacter guillouiae]|uniref:hypothetical protein n=1 Tax=Acinetobacter guillouiae TaxID=106649 RepID=UPI003AF55342
MTTINNSEKLIEKVGGIERAIALEAMLQKHAVPESWKISIINGMWHRSSVGFTHSDLRTAISEHDTTDHVTDIRNHVSPSTIVKDLEAERHG